MTSDSTSSAVSDFLVPPLVDPDEIDLSPLTEADVLLVALDFDGVLAPLQDDPDLSRVVPASATAIEALADLPRTRLALVSGRDVATLRELAAPPASALIIGSHGAEIDLVADTDDADAHDADANTSGANANSSDVNSSVADASGANAKSSATDLGDGNLDNGDLDDGNLGDSDLGDGSLDDPDLDDADASEANALTNDEDELLSAIDAHLAELAEQSDLEGFDLRIEYKPYSRTVHTRGMAEDLATALRAHVVSVQSEHGGIRVIEGHDITELAVSQATKGTGMRALVSAVRPTAAVYLGDDITDEDAFAELAELSPEVTGVRIKVGSAPTQAELRIADPDAVARLLTRLAEERAANTTA